MSTPKRIKTFVEKVGLMGGTCMLVGGAVIDSIQGGEPKDWDIEVYGLDQTEIEGILKGMRARFDAVGKSFGVLKTRLGGVEVDISLPRKDSKVGAGHRGFLVETDPFLDPQEAARRRDLTINSMGINLHTMELVDHFGGLQDLEEGILRATDPETFIEDPLRVLRVMQLLARKGKTVDHETIRFCKVIQHEFQSLPKERIFEEFNKLLLKSEKPSMGLRFLYDCFWITHFPELLDLVGCKQNPEWHPEGDVWQHTLLVIDNAAALRDFLPEELRLTFMYAALLHDIGKPSTTLSDLTSHGHDEAGAILAETFMRRITDETKLIEDVCALVRLHMRPGQLYRGIAGPSAWKRLSNEFRLDVLGYLCKADSAGRTGRSLQDEHHPSELCFLWASAIGTKKIEPLVKGRDLIEMGLTPGPEFGPILEEAYELQMEGHDKETILKLIQCD